MTVDPSSGASGGSRRTVVNVLSNWGAFLIHAAIGFLLSPFVVHRLGDEAYGVWALLGSLVGYLGLLDLGVRSAVTRHVAACRAAGRDDRASRIVSAALALFLGGAVGAVALSVAFAFWGLAAFDVPPHLADTARVVVLLGGLNVAVSIVVGVHGGTLVGLQRFDLQNGIQVGAGLLRAVAIVIGLSAGGGLVALAGIQLATSVAIGVVQAAASRRLYPALRLHWRGWDADDLRVVLSYGLFAFLIHVAGVVTHYSDAVVVGALLSVAQVTLFAIAGNLIDYARQTVSGISFAIAPMTGALDGSGRGVESGDLMLRGARIAALVSLPILVTFVLRGGTFIGLWMGPAYAAESGRVLALLALARWASAGFQVCSSGLMGLDRHRPLVPLLGLEALANLALSVALAGPLGIAGVALGTLIPRLVVTLWAGPWITREAVGVPLRRYWIETLGRPGLAIVPFALATWGVERAWPVAHLAGFFGQVALLLPLAAAGAFALALDPAERHFLADALRRGVRRSGTGGPRPGA